MLPLPPTASHAVLMTHGQHLEHNSHYYSAVGAAVIHSRASPVERSTSTVALRPPVDPNDLFITRVDSDKYRV